jgi:hypothetical protein
MTNFRGRRPVYVVVASALLVATVAAWFVPALSQTSPRQRELRIIKAGDACDRKTDKARGVVKIDACGRWYCGRADVKDIIEVRPRFAEEAGCTWRLEGTRCKCRRDPAPGKAR